MHKLKVADVDIFNSLLIQLLIFVSCRELGKYDESLETLNAALKLDWNNSQTHHLRGLLYVDSGNIEDAYDDFKVHLLPLILNLK